MYCSSCGANLTQNLVYCNRCGARLSNGAAQDDYSKAEEISPNILVCAMVATFIFGMAAVVALLSAARSGNPISILVLVLSFLLMLSLEVTFVWLLSRRRKIEKTANIHNQLNEQTRKELYEAPLRIMAEPIPSVTEETTGLLEPIRRERTSKELNKKA